MRNKDKEAISNSKDISFEHVRTTNKVADDHMRTTLLGDNAAISNSEL